VRVGLGCLRIPPDDDATIRAAIDGGVRVFDTARAYPGSEEQLARTLAADASAFVVTKCGMKRPDGGWQPDGRATAILEDARASLAALGRVPDLLLLHAPDPRVAFATSVRALARAKDEGLAKAIGVSNVTRRQLEEAASIAPIAAVEVAFGAFDDEAARSGILAWCATNDAQLLAHSPLGGPKRAPRLAGDPALRVVAKRHDVEPAIVVIAYLLAVHPAITPLVGARRPESIRGALHAAALALSEADLEILDARFPSLAALRRPPVSVASLDASRDVTILMGLAGAGKSRLAESYVARGYERLNRDTLGGTLRGIAKRLDEHLARGATRVVLDNTYVTRASRADVVRIAHGRGVGVRCVFVDTSLADAQVNVVNRMLAKYGELLGPDEIKQRAKKDPNTLAPTALFRMAKELEPPAEDEGFSAVETIPFVREEPPGRVPGVAIPYERLPANDLVDSLPQGTPVLVFAWRPPIGAAGEIAALAERCGRVIDFVACAHGEGPPVCWCRPPLPGAWLWFAHRRNVGTVGSFIVASTPAHRQLAAAVGVRTLDTP
jgi:aryl-alcohol dehydrogenase-like predicted oxidoreductase